MSKEPYPTLHVVCPELFPDLLEQANDAFVRLVQDWAHDRLKNASAYQQPDYSQRCSLPELPEGW